MRELTKKDKQFCWETKHQNAFEQLIHALCNAPVMSYFDKSKKSAVLVDASPVGLCAILSQHTPDKDDNTIVAYASRGFSAVEQRYSQTEKEALAIVWAVEHFHLYLFGAPFSLITDHKPLEVIYGNPAAKPSARLERWVLRLQPYEFDIIYKPGNQNPADYLSRHPNLSCKSTQEKLTENFVNFVTSYSIPKAMTLAEIKEATQTDKVLCGLRAAIRHNTWNSDLVKPFKQIKDELSVSSNNMILRGSRIVVPDSLQQKAIDIAHESHQGLAKTKITLK